MCFVNEENKVNLNQRQLLTVGVVFLYGNIFKFTLIVCLELFSKIPNFCVALLVYDRRRIPLKVRFISIKFDHQARGEEAEMNYIAVTIFFCSKDFYEICPALFTQNQCRKPCICSQKSKATTFDLWQLKPNKNHSNPSL